MKRNYGQFIILFALCGLPACGKYPSNNAWKSFSGDKHIEQRVDSVLKLMTLEEKIDQMTQFSAN